MTAHVCDKRADGAGPPYVVVRDRCPVCHEEASATWMRCAHCGATRTHVSVWAHIVAGHGALGSAWSDPEDVVCCLLDLAGSSEVSP